MTVVTPLIVCACVNVKCTLSTAMARGWRVMVPMANPISDCCMPMTRGWRVSLSCLVKGHLLHDGILGPSMQRRRVHGCAERVKSQGNLKAKLIVQTSQGRESRWVCCYLVPGTQHCPAQVVAAYRCVLRAASIGGELVFSLQQTFAMISL